MPAETITCKIILEQPVAGILYGLQSGSGHSYEVLLKQVAESGDLKFEFELPVKTSKEGRLVLHGPIVQGPPDSRFLYLDIGGYAGQQSAPVSGRLKVPLTHTHDDLTRASANAGLFETKIPGTKAKDGSPTTGTIKPFDGWKLT